MLVYSYDLRGQFTVAQTKQRARLDWNINL